MPFQTPITIKEAVNHIHRREYFLPAIQREFVWDTKRITKLFDSLMRDYPIGSFLFWKVDKEQIGSFQFYEFIKDYNEEENTHNPLANIRGEEAVTAILDGQQRLTALYISLMGSYAFRKGRGRGRQCLKRKLYINIAAKLEEDSESKYELDFFSTEEAREKNEKIFWFEVGKIFEFTTLRDISRFLKDNELQDNVFAEETLCCLFEVINQKNIINFYLETSQELDKVLNIFIRVNSGGMQLSYSDLLLSTASSQWKNLNAREEIVSFVNDLNSIGDGFRLEKDLVMKSCLVLNGLEIAFKVDNFNHKNTEKIEDNWADVSKALRLAVDLVASFGYNYQTLTSANALIPIAYYLNLLGGPDNFVQASVFQDDREKICKWLTMSLVKKVFGGQSDTVLGKLRKVLENNKGEKGFPLDDIFEEFKGTNKSLSFSEEDIEYLLSAKYGQNGTFSILSLLYPHLDYRNKFQQDHIFPRSWFEAGKLKKKDIPVAKLKFYANNFNYIGNLQLLEGQPNKEKSNQDFSRWLERNFKDPEAQTEYKRKNLIPGKIDLSFANFEEFLHKRNELIRKKLKTILS